MKKKVTMTLEFDLVDMDQEEWDEANEGTITFYDEGDAIEDFGPQGFVNSIAPYELEECIKGALDSRNYPEIFAGSGIFAHIENAKIVMTTISEGK